ncbi:hypothetical protein AAG570_001649 [Ranatra chinensis]|uniref:Uncharacterized protein n=1 Tax=Ranatra chinensis TaxID=642074 RepID=A0ABD0Y9Z1_9HEMI
MTLQGRRGTRRSRYRLEPLEDLKLELALLQLSLAERRGTSRREDDLRANTARILSQDIDALYGNNLPTVQPIISVDISDLKFIGLEPVHLCISPYWKTVLHFDRMQAGLHTGNSCNFSCTFFHPFGASARGKGG